MEHYCIPVAYLSAGHIFQHVHFVRNGLEAIPEEALAQIAGRVLGPFSRLVLAEIIVSVVERERRVPGVELVRLDDDGLVLQQGGAMVESG